MSAFTLLDDAAKTADQLVHEADVAMYAAKDAKRGATRRFRSAMTRRRTSAMLLDSVREGMVGQQFSVAYQPIVGCSTLSLVGLEALARWDHPDRGPISPLTFIRTAETAGLLVELEGMLIERACREVQQMRLDGKLPKRAKLHVNVSPIHLCSPRFVDDLATILRNTRLPPNRLCVEITETSLIRDAVSARLALESIRELGVKVALDDFGTGYSSLSHLHTFPLDTLKIDRTFVANVAQTRHQTIIRTMVDLARSLGLQTVAEGVETRQQLQMLQELGCTQLQGFLFGKPTANPDAQLPAWRRQSRRTFETK